MKRHKFEITDLIAKLKRLSHLIFIVILPQRCISCNKIIFSADIGFCQTCWQDIPWIFGKVCRICGNELASSASLSEVCLNCRIKKKPYDYSRSLVYYRGKGKDLVLRCKYSDHELLYRFIAKLITSRFGGDFIEVDIIVPIPLHIFRLFSRGHNQSSLLAKQLAKQNKINLGIDIIRRIKYTPILAGYTTLQRKALLNSAFDIDDKKLALIKNKNILLIDDVMSTTATINICSKLLKRHGAKQILVATIARTDAIQ